jgi:predicted RNA-binding Zn ribbon-like protein
MTDWVEDHFIAGHVALDFANTVFRRRPELGADLLTDAGALGAWLVRAGLLPAGSLVTDAALGEARAVRALLWRVFDAQEVVPADALTGLLDVAGRGSAYVAVRTDGSTTSSDAAGALAILALRTVTLVLDPPQQGVRTCDRCGWFFIDSSRGRRRRWCSMKTCGNQAKATRYRSTRHQPG